MYVTWENGFDESMQKLQVHMILNGSEKGALDSKGHSQTLLMLPVECVKKCWDQIDKTKEN